MITNARVARRSVVAAAVVAGVIATVALSGSAQASGGEGDPTAHYNWTDLDYKNKNVDGGELNEGDEPMSPPMILMFMNFGIVLFIIGWKVWPAIQGYTRSRHDSVKEALEEAAKLRQEAQKKLDEYTEQVKAAEAEVEKMIKDIRADAEAEKKRIIAAAETQAAALGRDAEVRIAAEVNRARIALEREVVAIAIAAAEKMLRDKATADDQTKLINTFIGDVQGQVGAAAGASGERT